jgi:type I restriction enzyme S subunit
VKWSAYASYRKSVEWLGEVPERWEVLRLGYLTQKVGSGKTPRGGAETYQSEGVLLIRSQNVHDTDLRLDDAAFIDESIDDEMAGTRVRSGDVLLNITGASLGRCAIAPESLPRANVNQHVCIVRINTAKALPRFVQRAISSRPVQEQIFSFENGSSREGLNFQQVRGLVLAVPSLSEQRIIADFLDRETAKLDTLVTRKEALIERLREKRMALISHIVTQGLPPDAARAVGLDPNPRLKASGNEWLGDVPVHWDVKRLKFVSPKITVGIVVEPSKYYESEGVPCLRSFNVKPGILSQRDLVYISREANRALQKSMLRKGDLVAVRTGQPGTTAVIDDFFDGGNCVDLIVIRRPKGGDSAFLSYFLNSTPAESQFAEGSGGAIQQHFNIATAGSLWLPVPPLHEQQRIAAFLATQVGQIDQMMAKVENAVARLQEYRTALITAAVTGKIDVRGAAA